MSVTQGNFPGRGFGTGAEAPPRPSLGRIFLEGMALAAGFVALHGIVKLVKSSFDAKTTEDEEGLPPASD